MAELRTFCIGRGCGVGGGHGGGGCGGGVPYPSNVIMCPPLLAMESMVECIDDFIFLRCEGGSWSFHGFVDFGFWILDFGMDSVRSSVMGRHSTSSLPMFLLDGTSAGAAGC